MIEAALGVEAKTSIAGAPNRKAVTQRKILRAAMELFAARGFHRTSIAQIAARADVSRTSIFWHFSDKATLFGETCRHFLVPFRESLERSSSHRDPRERLLQQIAAYESFIRERRETIRAFVSWVFASPPHADSLRHELLALHRAFQSSLERDMAEILESPSEASALAAMTVSILHGNTLLTLGGMASRADSARLGPVRHLLDRLLPPG